VTSAFRHRKLAQRQARVSPPAASLSIYIVATYLAFSGSQFVLLFRRAESPMLFELGAMVLCVAVILVAMTRTALDGLGVRLQYGPNLEELICGNSQTMEVPQPDVRYRCKTRHFLNCIPRPVMTLCSHCPFPHWSIVCKDMNGQFVSIFDFEARTATAA